MQDKVRIFVSSPSDVPAECVAVERVARRVAGQYDAVEIEVYRWEAGHYFSAHTGFEEQIEELGGFDLVVGILWSRIGSPLPAEFPARMPAPREGERYPCLRHGSRHLLTRTIIAAASGNLFRSCSFQSPT